MIWPNGMNFKQSYTNNNQAIPLSIPYKSCHFYGDSSYMWRKYRELKEIINKNLIYLINNLFITINPKKNPKLILKFNRYSQQINQIIKQLGLLEINFNKKQGDRLTMKVVSFFNNKNNNSLNKDK